MNISGEKKIVNNLSLLENCCEKVQFNKNVSSKSVTIQLFAYFNIFLLEILTQIIIIILHFHFKLFIDFLQVSTDLGSVFAVIGVNWSTNYKNILSIVEHA